MRVLIVFGLLVALALALALGALLGNGVARTDAPGLGVRLRLAMNANVATLGPDAPLPELRATAFDSAPAELALAAADACRRLGWTVTLDPAEPLVVEAVVTTGLLRFRDDLTLRALPGAAPGTATLRGESRSRVGRADFGANAAHLRRLLAELNR